MKDRIQLSSETFRELKREALAGAKNCAREIQSFVNLHGENGAPYLEYARLMQKYYLGKVDAFTEIERNRT